MYCCACGYIVDCVVKDVSDIVTSVSLRRLANLYLEKQKFSLTLCWSRFVFTNLACRSSSVSLSFLRLSRSLLFLSLFLSCFIILNITCHNCLVVLLIKALLFIIHVLSFMLPGTEVYFIIHYLYVRRSDVLLSIVFYRSSPVNCMWHFNDIPSTTDQCGASLTNIFGPV